MRTILKLLSQRYPRPPVLPSGNNATDLQKKRLDQWTRASWQQAVLAFLQAHAEEWNIRVRPAVRFQTGPDHLELADVAVFRRDLPVEQLTDQPPLAVFEIVLPEHDGLLTDRCKNFAALGVKPIWLVNAGTGRFPRYAEGRLTEAEHFGGPGDRMHFQFAGIASFLD